MSNNTILLTLLCMIITMIILRVIPMMFFKEKIKNKFLKSLFAYVPSTVLTALIVPEVFRSTSSPISAWIGFIVAIILAYCEKSLITVSLSTVVVAFITECIMRAMNVL